MLEMTAMDGSQYDKQEFYILHFLIAFFSRVVYNTKSNIQV